MTDNDGVSASERHFPGGASPEELGINPDDLILIRGVSLVGGGMWSDENPPPGPIASVIMTPRDTKGNDLDPLGIVLSPHQMRQLRDKFYEVFTLAAEAAETMFANNGDLGA